MPAPTQRIALVLSPEDYAMIKAAADKRTEGNVSRLLRDALRALGVKVS